MPGVNGFMCLWHASFSGFTPQERQLWSSGQTWSCAVLPPIRASSTSLNSAASRTRSDANVVESLQLGLRVEAIWWYDILQQMSDALPTRNRYILYDTVLLRGEGDLRLRRAMHIRTIEVFGFFWRISIVAVNLCFVNHKSKSVHLIWFIKSINYVLLICHFICFFWNHCHILSPCITLHWVSQSPCRWVPFWWQTLRTSVASWPLENIQVPSNIAMWWRPPRTSPCEGHVLAWSSSNIRTAGAC